MTLDQAAFQQACRIVSFDGDDAEIARLTDFGLIDGATVTKIQATPLRDPVSCLVGTQLIALQRRILRRIRVEAA